MHADTAAPPPTEAQRLLRRWAWLLPLLLVLLAYANAFNNGFVWDDHMLIEEQHVVRVLYPPDTYFGRMFWSDPMKVSRGFYRPLVTWSYALEFQLWEGHAEGFHVTNVLLHLGVVALLYALIRRTGASPGAAALGAALFGVFPRLTESVTWVSGRTDVLASLFGFAALLVHRPGPGRAASRWAAAGLFLLGLFCKEVTVAALPALLLLELRASRAEGPGPWRGLRGGLVRLAPYAVAFAIYGVLRTYAASQDVRVQTAVLVGLPLLERGPAALAALGSYLRMVADPLRPETQIGTLGVHPWYLVVPGALLAIGAAVGVRLAWRRLGALPLGALLGACAALAMVLHVVPLAVNVLAADRFLYVPLALLAVALTRPVAEGLGRRRALGAVAAVGLLALFATATASRNLDWHDDYALWRQAEESGGDNPDFVASQLGILYMEQHRYERALQYLERAAAPGSNVAGVGVYNNIAVCLKKLGRYEEAIGYFEQMVAKQPLERRVHFNLIMAYAAAFRFDEAEQRWAQASATFPEDPTLGVLRGVLVEARATAPELLPPREGEPVERKVKRAQLYERLGASLEAAEEWARVLSDPGASPRQRLRATAFLVTQGDVARGEAALARLRTEQPDARQLPVLEETLRERLALE
jgi:pentatricopeptide repeat protein